MKLTNDHKGEGTRWAHDRLKKRIDVFDLVEGGLNGYSCRGCGGEVVAVLCKERRSYFRHHAPERSPLKRCTYSDKDERYKIAKESIQRLRRIKVPTLYKQPPEGTGGFPMKIVDSHVVEAFKIEIERYFYLDESNYVRMGQETHADGLTFLFKADAVFVDQSENPILLVQFIDNHSLQSLAIKEKTGLRHIGIDAIQIKIPRESAEAIEAAFLSASNSKWIFNNDYDAKEYERPTGSDGGKIPPIDELQGQLLEENFNCRRAQITRLIRQLTIHRQSNTFVEFAGGIRFEISAVEDTTNRIRDLQQQFHREAKERVQREFAHENTDLDRRREALDRKKARLTRVASQITKD